MSHIPRLDTGRLLLRGFEERDFDSYASMVADPQVTRYLGNRKGLAGFSDGVLLRRPNCCLVPDRPGMESIDK